MKSASASLPLFRTRTGGGSATITLVRPPTVTSAGAVGQDAVPPLGVAYVAAALRLDGHTVSIVDAVGEAVGQYTRIEGHPNALVHGLRPDEIARRLPPEPQGKEIIGVSCMFSVEWPETRRVVEALRAARPRALIVVGGEHVTACPDYTLENCSAVDVGVLGEGEETMVDLARAIVAGRALFEVRGIVFRQNKSIVHTESRQRIRAIDEIPAPAWDLVPVENYIANGLTHGANLGRCMPILATRGCPYRCTFCSSPKMWTTLWSARSPRAVLEEMKEYIRRYQVTNFDFYDLTAVVKRSWIIELSELLIAEKLHITWQLPSGTRSEAIDEEVARLMSASGGRIVNYAPESGSAPELKRIKKRVDLGAMIQSMQGAHKAGLQIKANFVFGFPDSSWGDVARTFRFIAHLAWIGVDDINAFPFSPYPGSELFEQLLGAGKLQLNEDYFRSLLAYTDPQHSISFAEFIGSRELSWLNISAMAYFYGLSFLFRPWRAVKLATALLTGDVSTKLTMAVGNRRRKLKALRLLENAVDGTVVLDAISPAAVGLPGGTRHAVASRPG